MLYNTHVHLKSAHVHVPILTCTFQNYRAIKCTRQRAFEVLIFCFEAYQQNSFIQYYVPVPACFLVVSSELAADYNHFSSFHLGCITL